jgi:CRISPR/Cas system CMR-associated protein Cmr5 small subunit
MTLFPQLKTDSVSISWNLKLAFPALVAGRLLLALTSLPDALKHDHQLSSPLTSYSNRVFSMIVLNPSYLFIASFQCRKDCIYSSMELTRILEAFSDTYVSKNSRDT